MKQKLDNTGNESGTLLPAISPKQQAFNWDDGKMSEESSNAEAGLGGATNEPKRRTDAQGLNPMWDPQFAISFVDEFVTEGESPAGLVINTNEIFLLALYWSTEIIDLRFKYFLTGSLSSSEWHMHALADQRLTRIAEFVGQEEVNKVFKQVEQILSELVDAPTWRIFTTGTEEEKDRYRQELRESLFHDSDLRS